MKPLGLVFLLIFVQPACLTAQQVRDDLDVTDGANPTLRYGFYTSPSGQVQMGRYYFIDDGSDLRVSLVPFGRTVVELPVRGYDREAGTLEFGWEGRPVRECRLDRHGNDLFLGNCLEGEAVMPIAIRVVGSYDEEWTGAHLRVSRTDFDIVERAAQLFAEQDGRNLNGDRNCDDDKDGKRVSVFCALYLASIEVAGVYRHRRPAMQKVRDVLRQRFPGEYAHILRDINNRTDIADEDIAAALATARREMLPELPASER